MAVVSPRLVAATRAQLTARQRLLDAGAGQVGWKLGMGDREGIGGHIVVGYLTSATVLEPGSGYDPSGAENLHVDMEAYVELAGDGPDAIGGYGVALEIVDLTPVPGEPRGSGTWPEDISSRLDAAAEVLEAVGASMRAGDRIITGSVVQVPVAAGDSITALIDGDAAVSLKIV